MSNSDWWGNWRPNLPAHTGDLQPTDLIECTSIIGGQPVNTAITGQQIINAASSGGASWGSITGTLSAQTDLQSALNAKQDTLVSGNNIKTINSTSLVGSGDVAVQPTLVSGTNIKTVNGNSLLGSGNLTISGGGGLAGLNVLTAIPSGLTYGFTAAITAAIPTTYITQFNGIVLSPLILARNMTYTSIRINVTSFTAGCLSRIVIYSDLNGLPDSKLYESANIDCSTNGLKTVTVTGSFTAGTVYWIGIHSNNNCTITGINQGATIPIMNTLINGSTVVAWRYSYVFGSAPATLNQANRTYQQGTLQTILFVI